MVLEIALGCGTSGGADTAGGCHELADVANLQAHDRTQEFIAAPAVMLLRRPRHNPGEPLLSDQTAAVSETQSFWASNWEVPPIRNVLLGRVFDHQAVASKSLSIRVC